MSEKALEKSGAFSISTLTSWVYIGTVKKSINDAITEALKPPYDISGIIFLGKKGTATAMFIHQWSCKECNDNDYPCKVYIDLDKEFLKKWGRQCTPWDLVGIEPPLGFNSEDAKKLALKIIERYEDEHKAQ
jgi:hypothetical protein